MNNRCIHFCGSIVLLTADGISLLCWNSSLVEDNRCVCACGAWLTKKQSTHGKKHWSSRRRSRNTKNKRPHPTTFPIILKPILHQMEKTGAHFDWNAVIYNKETIPYIISCLNPSFIKRTLTYRFFSYMTTCLLLWLLWNKHDLQKNTYILVTICILKGQ